MKHLQNRPLQASAWWIFTAVWFALWQLVHTWQVWQDPAGRVPGPIGDNAVMLWNLGWVRHALNHGHPGFWFANAYYPDGFLFLYGTHTWLDGLLGWIFSPLLPGGTGASILWANITMFSATVFSGLAIVSLLRAWGIRHWPVLILVASGVAFSWFRMFALQGHYHFYGTQWMLLSLALVSWYRKAAISQLNKSLRLLIMAGLSLGLTFLNDQTMAVFGGILGGMVIVSLIPAKAGRRLVETGKHLLIYYGLALILASVHLVPLIVAASEGSFNYFVSLDTPRLVDATSLILPPDISWLGSRLTGMREEDGLTWSEGTYLGLVPIMLLVLITIGALRFILTKPAERPQSLRICFFTALTSWFFVLLALGDTFMVGSELYNAMPGRILRQIPVLNNIRLPQRWVWPAQLCIALGGASLLATWLSQSKRTFTYWVPLAVALVPGLEAIRYPAAAPMDYRNDPFINPPGLMQSVRQHYKSGGVLVMPAEIAYAHSNVFQFQWGYNIPISVAYTARMPFKIQELPWKGSGWTPQTAEWLTDKKVGMVVFSFHGGDVAEYQSWIKEAKIAVPHLVVLNRFGEII